MACYSSASEGVLSKLNPQQRQAATHGRGPLLIVAGAGTGKTTTLAHRVAHLIATGTDPGRILLLTFTRRAAAEMLRRVDGILRDLEGPSRAGKKVWGGTFHAVSTRLLRRWGKHLDLPADFTILDRGDSEDLMHVVRGELGFGKDQDRGRASRQRQEATRFPLKGTCLNIYSQTVNRQRALRQVLTSEFPWCLEHESGLLKLFDAYVDRKESAAVLDYDDLLLFWRALMQDEQAGRSVREQFDCVLVDEYQDTNAVQADILRGLCADGEGLTVVGDDAQSIYSFRAATIRNILDFPTEFPGTTIVKLEQNYRSTQPILRATNRVIAAAREAHCKELWSEREQGEPPQMVLCEDEDEQTEFLIEQILTHRERGLPLQRQAVLFRASHHSISLEVELARRNIPFHKFGGLKFVETAHVKDALAFLRLAENPRDVISCLRVLVLIPGIGQVKARQLTARLQEHNGDFLCWRDVAAPKAASTDWPLFIALMAGLASTRDEQIGLGEQLHRVRKYYAPLLERRYDDVHERTRDLEQLEVVSGRFTSRRDFINEMSLDPPTSTQELASNPLLDEEFLVLSTIHSAKGLEWDAVYVIHAADGNIPSDLSTDSADQIEEERRLFYVALTRAKDWLYVTIPHRYYFHGRWKSDMHSYAQPTRFLSDDVRECFVQSVGGLFAEDPLMPDDATSSVRDVRAGLKGLWRGESASG